MVQAGAGTDAVIEQLADRFEEGDIIVDGGNANFHDTIRREQALRERGLNFVGAGISGGEEGALNGPSIMPGGSAEAYETLGPILASIAAVAEGEPCVTHVGTDGAGHFVKMIHNGIEYADMQLIGESYDLLRRVGGHDTDAIADIFAAWNEGDLESYLIEITAEVLRHRDAETGEPLVDVIVDQAGSKGTGVWTVQNAVGLGIPVGGIAEAVFARAVSSKPAQREAVRGVVETRPELGTAGDGFEDDVRAALYASKVVAYAQGFDAIIAGAEEYDWDIHLGNIAKIWRGGCIIRARFLNRIVEAYERDTQPATLLEDPYFADVIRDGEAAWRRIVATAVQSGVPVPGLLLGAGLLRLARVRAPARLADPGPARLLRRPHLRAGRQARHVPHPVVRRPLGGQDGPVGAPVRATTGPQRPPGERSCGAGTRTPNNCSRDSRVANYTTPHWAPRRIAEGARGGAVHHNARCDRDLHRRPRDRAPHPPASPGRRSRGVRAAVRRSGGHALHRHGPAAGPRHVGAELRDHPVALGAARQRPALGDLARGRRVPRVRRARGRAGAQRGGRGHRDRLAPAPRGVGQGLRHRGRRRRARPGVRRRSASRHSSP